MAPVAASGPLVLAAGNLDGTATSWLEANWMFFSWAFALFGSGALAARFHSHGPHWFGWLAVAMYCLHQSEEHAYDVRGWRYAFVPAMNQGFGSTLFGAATGVQRRRCQLPSRPKADAVGEHCRNLGWVWRLHDFRILFLHDCCDD